MEKLEVFIVVHDQNIILDYEQNSKFRNLKLYRYVFVGSGETDKIDSTNKVIIARNLPDNIEKKKYLVSFTAWYALAKNNLVNTEFVCLLEYDVDLSDYFWEETVNALDSHVIVGYVPVLLNHISFYGATPYLSKSLINVYGIDPIKLTHMYIQNTNDNVWAATTNMTMSTENFRKFVEWFIPLIKEFDDNPISAHVHERAVKIFCILFNLDVRYLPYILKHWEKRSHKIEANLCGMELINQGRYEEAIKELEKFLRNNNFVNNKDIKANILICLSQVYFKQGKFSKAEEELKKSLSLEPPDRNTKANILTALSNVHSQQGKFKEAEEFLKEALALEPPDRTTMISIHYALGSNYERSRQFEKAKEEFGEVIKFAEKVPSLVNRNNFLGGVHFHLGCIYQRMQDKEEARQYFEECLKFIPQHTKAKENLEKLYC